MAAPLNLMALDFGESRIGLATANSISKLSSPLKTIPNDESKFLDIAEIVSSESINILVVGLPRNLNGEDTSQTESARRFAEDLKQSVEVPVFMEDEALSSVRAKKTLDESKKAYEKADVDALAACYILDDFMSHHDEVVNV